MSFNEADVGVLNKEEIELAGGSKRKEKKAGGKWKLHVTWNREEKNRKKRGTTRREDRRTSIYANIQIAIYVQVQQNESFDINNKDLVPLWRNVYNQVAPQSHILSWEFSLPINSKND